MKQRRRLAGMAVGLAALTACSSAPLPSAVTGPDGVAVVGSPTPMVDPLTGQVVVPTTGPGGTGGTGGGSGATGGGATGGTGTTGVAGPSTTGGTSGGS